MSHTALKYYSTVSLALISSRWVNLLNLNRADLIKRKQPITPRFYSFQPASPNVSTMLPKHTHVRPPTFHDTEDEKLTNHKAKQPNAPAPSPTTPPPPPHSEYHPPPKSLSYSPSWSLFSSSSPSHHHSQ